MQAQLERLSANVAPLLRMLHSGQLNGACVHHAGTRSNGPSRRVDRYTGIGPAGHQLGPLPTAVLYGMASPPPLPTLVRAWKAQVERAVAQGRRVGSYLDFAGAPGCTDRRDVGRYLAAIAATVRCARVNEREEERPLEHAVVACDRSDELQGYEVLRQIEDPEHGGLDHTQVCVCVCV